MTPTTKEAGRIVESVPLTRGAAGPYMLTLCSLASPVSIRPPQSPHLKPFTFFTSRARHADGSERLHLHMGYFATQEQATKWAQLMRGRYPMVAVSPVPAEILGRDSRVPTLSAAPPRPTVNETCLSDTQVIQVLASRRAAPMQENTAAEDRNDVSILRPEDTNTRRILKEAVVRGAPVSFSVQLHSSVEPIELASLPGLSIFRAYTLYLAQGARQGHVWYGLRLGFFDDAISAKQVAYYVRKSFASVAVVPISDEERTSGTSRPIDPSVLGDPVQQRIEQRLEADQPRALPGASPASTPTPASASRPQTGARASHETLEQTLEMLAASEIWSNPDSLSETGVRHLKVNIRR